ncbi:MAG: anaerobic carbon-monoxide dehydrogenase catalytic subunit [Thermoleophilia bacterium]
MRYRYPKLNAEMPDRADVLDLTPSAALPPLVEHMASCDLPCYLDRSDAQQRLCSWGLDGTCCRRCLWGPCRVTDSKPGICGAGPAQVVMGNHLRMVAAAAAAHGSHARARLETILAVTEGREEGPLRGMDRVRWLAERLGVPQANAGAPRPDLDLAREVTLALYDDLSKARPGPMRLLHACAPPERLERWRELGVLPTSTMAEVFESLHRTTLGTDSDWRNTALQELRLALAFFWGAVVPASFASEILYGRPSPTSGEVGFGMLARGRGVKVAVHGHLPVAAEALLAAAEEPEILAEAEAAGADGFDFYGICCSGQELLARHGVPSVTGILGQEFALATGALDALVVDLQCVVPAIMPVARAKGTVVVTTHESNRLEGAVHMPAEPGALPEVARKILKLACDAHRLRAGTATCVPAVTAPARGGFDDETVLEAFGGANELLALLRRGDITGLATLVSCNTPKVPFERSNVVLAKELLRRGVLITTTGCAAHALLDAGLTADAARDLCAPQLRGALERAALPPVIPVGACVDNTRTMFLWLRLAEAAGTSLSALPLFYVGAEPGNEKALGMGMAFLAHGVNVLSGFPIPVPVPSAEHIPGAAADDMRRVANPVADFFSREAVSALGARIVVEPAPELAAGVIHMDFKRKRWALGW